MCLGLATETPLVRRVAHTLQDNIVRRQTMLTQEKLKELLHYDPETGIFIWLERTSKKIRVGDTAGCINKKNGYRYIRIQGTLYLAHRLAWMYITGSFPDFQIDHEDHVRTRNVFNNLRNATNKSNGLNQSLSLNNTSGFNGVTWHSTAKKWQAQITIDGNNIYLGLFENIEDAISKRKAANIEYKFHANHGLVKK